MFAKFSGSTTVFRNVMRHSRQPAKAGKSLRIGSLAKELGWGNATLYLIGRLLERASGGRARLVRYVLVAQPIGGQQVPPLRAGGATQIRTVGANDALAASFPRPAEVLRRRWHSGATCTAALVRDEFAGFIWLKRDYYEEDEVRCTYVLESRATSVWDFDVYVEPRYRIGRTMARLWAHVDAELASSGVRWSFSRISAFNRASLASHARLGAVPCASALFVTAGRWQLSLIPGQPFVHLSASKNNVPVIRLLPPA